MGWGRGVGGFNSGQQFKRIRIQKLEGGDLSGAGEELIIFEL